MKAEEKKAMNQEKLQMKAAKEAEKLARETAKAERENEKRLRQIQKEQEKQDKEAFKGKVKDLRAVFPKMNKDELKALVEQNITLPTDQLKEKITNYRIAKSTSK